MLCVNYFYTPHLCLIYCILQKGTRKEVDKDKAQNLNESVAAEQLPVARATQLAANEDRLLEHALRLSVVENDAGNMVIFCALLNTMCFLTWHSHNSNNKAWHWRNGAQCRSLRQLRPGSCRKPSPALSLRYIVLLEYVVYVHNSGYRYG